MSTPPGKSSSHTLPEWMRREERGSAFWLALMTWISLTFGRRVSRMLLPFIALYFTIAATKARRSSRDYLNRCLDRRPNLIDVYRHILTFATTIHDRVYLLNNRRDRFDIRLFGAEQLHADVAARGGVLIFGGHLGSFEVLRAASEEMPVLRVFMAMHSENARRINRTLAAINRTAKQNVIELGRVDSMLTIDQRLQEGALVGMLADRATGVDHYFSVPFLGANAHFPSGPFRIATVLRRPVYFMAGLYRGGNRYDLHFELLSDPSASPDARVAFTRALLDRYVTTMEKHCRAAPYNWFNFFDFWQSTGQERS